MRDRVMTGVGVLLERHEQPGKHGIAPGAPSGPTAPQYLCHLCGEGANDFGCLVLFESPGETEQYWAHWHCVEQRAPRRQQEI